jgi:hypothetical protein
VGSAMVSDVSDQLPGPGRSRCEQNMPLGATHCPTPSAGAPPRRPSIPLSISTSTNSGHRATARLRARSSQAQKDAALHEIHLTPKASYTFRPLCSRTLPTGRLLCCLKQADFSRLAFIPAAMPTAASLSCTSSDCAPGCAKDPYTITSDSPPASGSTSAERDYIRHELDQFFRTFPSVAEGFRLRTWRGGPQKGQPKLPPPAKTVVDRGLMRLDRSSKPSSTVLYGCGDGCLATDDGGQTLRGSREIRPRPERDWGRPGCRDKSRRVRLRRCLPGYLVPRRIHSYLRGPKLTATTPDPPPQSDRNLARLSRVLDKPAT